MNKEKTEYYKNLITKMIPENIIGYEIKLDGDKFYITIDADNISYNKLKKYCNDLFNVLTLTDENGNELFRGNEAIIVSTNKDFEECKNNIRNYIIKIAENSEKYMYTLNTNTCKLQHYLPIFFQKNFYNLKSSEKPSNISYYKILIENDKYDFYKSDYKNNNVSINKTITKKTIRKVLSSVGSYNNLFFNEDNCYLDNIITKNEFNECLTSDELNEYIKKNTKHKVITQENSELGTKIINNIMFPLYNRSVYRFKQIKEEISEHLSNRSFIESIGIKDKILKKRLDEALLTDVNSVSKKLYNSYVSKNIDLKIDSNTLTLQHMKNQQNFILSENVVFALNSNNEVKCQLKEDENLKGLFLIYKKYILVYVGEKLTDNEFKNFFENMNNVILKYATDFISVDHTRSSTNNILKTQSIDLNQDAKEILENFRKKAGLKVNRDIKILDNDFIKELIIEKANNILTLHKIELEKESQKTIKNEESNIRTSNKIKNLLEKEKSYGFLRRKRARKENKIESKPKIKFY